jgi:hypothetical protein
MPAWIWSWATHLDTWAKIAQIGTMVIALGAAAVAYRALQVQSHIARKRAAIDLFFKTEMDQTLIDTFNKYETAIDGFNRTKPPIESFATTPDYKIIRSILDIHELIAVGIHNEVLDDTVCYEYWGDEMLAAYPECKAIIEHARKQQRGSSLTYVDLERLCTEWEARYTEWEARQKILEETQDQAEDQA